MTARQSGPSQLLGYMVPALPPRDSNLTMVYDRFEAKGLVVLAISGEAPDTLRKFVAEYEVRFPVLVDPGTKVGEQAFHVGALPASFIYDRSGRLVAQAPSAPTMERLLKKLELAGLH